MNKVLGMLAGTALLVIGGVAQASTFNFTLSDGHGSGPFGEVTTTDLGGGSVKVEIDMSPNWVIEGGGDSHHALTFSTSLAGTISGLTAGFTALPYIANPHGPPDAVGYTNNPFKLFTNAIDGVGCAPAGEGGCGSTLEFTISNFGAFIAATDLFGTSSVFAAVDIFNQATEETFVVGLGVNPTPETQCAPGVACEASPTPIPGAVWLFGTVLAGGAGYGRWRKKRKAQLAA